MIDGSFEFKGLCSDSNYLVRIRPDQKNIETDGPIRSKFTIEEIPAEHKRNVEKACKMMQMLIKSQNFLKKMASDHDLSESDIFPIVFGNKNESQSSSASSIGSIFEKNSKFPLNFSLPTLKDTYLSMSSSSANKHGYIYLDKIGFVSAADQHLIVHFENDNSTLIVNGEECQLFTCHEKQVSENEPIFGQRVSELARIVELYKGQLSQYSR
ncbi:MAG: hypothetical protein MHPSP_002265 [Paramarteilia canceri]